MWKSIAFGVMWSVVLSTSLSLAAVDHSVWDTLLKRYVDADGRVAYHGPEAPEHHPDGEQQQEEYGGYAEPQAQLAAGLPAPNPGVNKRPSDDQRDNRRLLGSHYKSARGDGRYFDRTFCPSKSG